MKTRKNIVLAIFLKPKSCWNIADFRFVTLNSAVLLGDVPPWYKFIRGMDSNYPLTDDYSQEARFWYDMWATTGNKLGDLGNGFKDIGRGLWDAAVDLVDGVFSLALYLIFGGFVFSGTVSLPDMVEERCKGVDAGIQAMLRDPLGTIEVLGQSMTDTYEEEGLAYAAGYISLDVITEIVATKGLGGAKGTAKAADTASDAASVVKKVDTVTDVAGAAKKVDTVTDTASAAKKVDTVTDAAKTADKATDAAKTADKVSDAAGAAKKVDTVTDTASAAKKADTATDAADAVHTVDKIEETSDAAKTADKTVDAAEKVDGLEAKGGTGSGTASEVESIPEPNLGVEGSRYSTQISPEMEKKILEGQRKSPVKNEVIGGHSPQINNSNDLFAVEELSVNADGTRNIKFVKDLQDGNISKIKKSTVFPDSWSDSKIIDSIKEVGDSPVISVRGRDGATWHRKIIDGVEIDVIKLGDDVISGYPTGKVNAPKPSGF